VNFYLEKIDTLVPLLAIIYINEYTSSSLISVNSISAVRPLTLDEYTGKCATCDAELRQMLNQIRLVIIGGSYTMFINTFPSGSAQTWAGVGAAQIVNNGADVYIAPLVPPLRIEVPTAMPTQDIKDKYINPAIDK
jgi:trimethylamine:corrinoid methyltransferase-like protein